MYHNLLLQTVESAVLLRQLKEIAQIKHKMKTFVKPACASNLW